MATTVPEDQLLELLQHLRNSTREAARSILNSQPQIGIALLSLMVKMNAIDVEVTQNTIANHAGPVPSPAPTPTPYRAPAPPQAHDPPKPEQMYTGVNHYSQPDLPSQPPPAMTMAGMPQDQMAVMQQLLMMPLEEVAKLPPDQRATVMQIRASMGM